MILVLAGTRDGRDLALELANEGYNILLSAFSEYGGELARQANLTVRVGALDAVGLQQLLEQQAIAIVVDASHPYAANISRNAMNACQQTGKPYIRYERPIAVLPDYQQLYQVPTAAEAAKLAATLGKVVFLTTGSRTLAVFKSEPTLSAHRIITRVLPDPTVLKECLELGFQPRDIVAIEGPFSHNMNIVLFRDYQAEVIVTKNSGQVGGSDTKISAAMELNLPLVVINRPTISYSLVGHCSERIIQLIKEVYSK